MDNKILMIFTGGTIAMKFDEHRDAVVAGLGPDELVDMVDDVNNLAQIESMDFANIPSPHITPNHMLDLANIVKENIKREDLTGIVITHGTDKIENKVALIKTVAGMESDIIDFYIEKGYKGIVIEGLGCGNLPPAAMDGIKRAIDKKIPLVLVSRCPNGSVEPIYGHEGGGKRLKDLGLIFGGSQSGHKTRIKLMLKLGTTNEIGKIKDFFIS